MKNRRTTGFYALRLLLALLILGAAARIAKVTGPDAVGRAADFRAIFLASTAWGEGKNPYDIDAIRGIYERARGPRDETVAEEFDAQVDGVPKFWHDTPPLYPPTTLAAVWPMTRFPFPAARVVWLGLNVALTALAWMAAVRLAGLEWSDWRALLLAAIWILLGPFNTCVRLGNPMSHALCLSILAVWCAFNRFEIAAGLLVAVATALKPQVGGAFILYFLLVRRWRASVLAVALLGLVTVVAVGRLAAAHVAWLGALQANLHAASTGGGFNDPSAANPWRWHMLNLQYPLHTFLDSRAAVAALTWLITVALSLAYVRALWVASPDRPEMLAAGVPAILCLLPVYHRYYDAVLMVIPLAWAVSTLRPGGRGRGWALLALACTAPFYVSWSWTFDHWIQTGRLPAALANTWWWNSLVMPCQTWALLVLLGSLFGALTAYRAARPAEERYAAAPPAGASA